MKLSCLNWKEVFATVLKKQKMVLLRSQDGTETNKVDVELSAFLSIIDEIFVEKTEIASVVFINKIQQIQSKSYIVSINENSKLLIKTKQCYCE